MHPPQGGKQPTIFLSYDAYESYQWPLWHNNLKGPVVAHISLQLPKALYLKLKLTQQHGKYCLVWQT